MSARVVRASYTDCRGCEWEVEGTIYPGCAEVPVSMDGPGLPADPAEIDDIVVIADGGQRRSPEDLFGKGECEAIEEKLWQAADDDGPW